MVNSYVQVCVSTTGYILHFRSQLKALMCGRVGVCVGGGMRQSVCQTFGHLSCAYLFKVNISLLVIFIILREYYTTRFGNFILHYKFFKNSFKFIKV